MRKMHTWLAIGFLIIGALFLFTMPLQNLTLDTWKRIESVHMRHPGPDSQTQIAVAKVQQNAACRSLYFSFGSAVAMMLMAALQLVLARRKGEWNGQG